MFFVFLFGVKTNKLFGVPTREQATYNWPCEKHEFSKIKPAIVNDWPCALLMVIAKARRKGNWSRLNWNGKSLEIIGIRGISTSSPLNLPPMIVASIKFGEQFLMVNLVPLHNFGAFKLRIRITSDPTFNVSTCGGIPGGSNEFKNSVG